MMARAMRSHMRPCKAGSTDGTSSLASVDDDSSRGRPAPTGQKTQRPAPRSSAGASVTQATKATSKQSAIEGPPLLNLPKSAKAIIPRPSTVVMALPTSAWPTCERA